MRHPIQYMAYPPSSLPVRDLFLLDHVAYDGGTEAMEIGIGSGKTTVRLATRCASVLGVDVSRQAVEALRYLEPRCRDLAFCVADAGGGAALGRMFDLVVSFDTLEHVPDPRGYFAFVRRHLRPGGTAHVLFPNDPPDSMHGVTRFGSEAELRAAAGDGFARVSVHRVELNRWAERVTFWCFGIAKRVVRRRRQRAARRRAAAARPGGAPEQQVFHETAFFRTMDVWKRFSPLLNLYWCGVLTLCRLGGPAYRIEAARPEDFRRMAYLYVRLDR